jgi:uncharacterized protein
MTTTVGTAEAAAGSLTRGELRVGSMPDGTPIRLPVMIAAGQHEGPRVWVQGCIHGAEFGGTAAIIQVLNELQLDDFRGTVIGVPVVNPPAFNFQARISPLDGANMNRVFPGDAAGSHSEQVAAALAEQMKTNADYVLDLHSGGIGAEVPFYAIFSDDGSDTAAMSRFLAKRVGCDVLWALKGEAGLGGSAAAEASRHGIPSMMVECGGGIVTPQHVENFKTAIVGLLQALDMAPGDAPVQDSYTIVEDGVFINHREGGLIVPECKVGAILDKGDLIARVVNLYGDTVEEIRCPADNAYIAANRLPYWPSASGNLVSEAIPVKSTEGL